MHAVGIRRDIDQAGRKLRGRKRKRTRLHCRSAHFGQHYVAVVADGLPYSVRVLFPAPHHDYVHTDCRNLQVREDVENIGVVAVFGLGGARSDEIVGFKADDEYSWIRLWFESEPEAKPKQRVAPMPVQTLKRIGPESNQ